MKIKKNLMVIITTLVIMSLLSGCGATKLSLNSSFWNTNKGKKIAIAIIELPKAGAYKEGQQGLLDMAINSVMAGSLESHLATLDLNSFTEVADEFITKFETFGLIAKKIEKQHPIKCSIETQNGVKILRHNAKTIIGNQDVDFVLLLEVKRFGTTRSYWGFIPTSDPWALCESRGYLINAKTNELLWTSEMIEKESKVKSIGEWDQSPDFPNLTKAISKSIDNAKAFLITEFFGKGK